MSPRSGPALDQLLRLIAAADSLRYQHPQRALQAALAARDTVAAADRALLGEIAWRALQAEAWSVLGSAYRGVGDLHHAESALAVAVSCLGDDAFPGPSETAPQAPIRRDTAPFLDPTLPLRVAQRATYLRSDQARFDEALALNRFVLEAALAQDDPSLHGRALVDRALVLRRSGRADEAIPALEQALGVLDPRVDARNVLAAWHNLALCRAQTATEVDDWRAVESALARALEEHRRSPLPMHREKLRYLEAIVRLRLGDSDGGVDLLWRTHDTFAALGAELEQATVLVHLAELAIEAGREDQVRHLAGRLFPLLRRLPLDAESGESLRRFLRFAQEPTRDGSTARRARMALEGRADLL